MTGLISSFVIGFKHVKTTLAGLASIAAGIGMLAPELALLAEGKPINMLAVKAGCAMIAGGVGLIFAKDADKSNAPPPVATAVTTPRGFSVLPTVFLLFALSAAMVLALAPFRARADDSPFRWSVSVPLRGNPVLVPAVAITPFVLSLRDGTVTTGPTFGAGGELLWQATRPAAYGVAAYANLRPTASGMKPLVSLLGVFTPYLGAGFGYQFGGIAPFRDSLTVLVSVGTNLGYVPPATAAVPAN